MIVVHRLKEKLNYKFEQEVLIRVFEIKTANIKPDFSFSSESCNGSKK
jgi:hypothetical protein